MSHWIVTRGSVTGTSHTSQGEEKQDSIAVVEDIHGNVSFCLSDGAGSSKNSKFSSSITSQFMAQELSKLPSMIEERGTGSWINDYIIQCIINLRAALYEKFDTYDLRDYHCTLVSGIFFKNTCLVAHIGDGAVLSGTVSLDNNECLLNEKLYFSEPENGEYKNETYFLTEPNWLKHLRIKVVPNVSWLIAGTDGGIDLLSVGDRLQDQLVLEILTDLIDCPSSERNQNLERIMSSDKADEKTNDDKTLIIITSSEISRNCNPYWQLDANTITDFYPKIQKKNDAPKNLDLTPSAVIESSHDSLKLLKNKNIIRRVYDFFHQQTILTIVLLLVFVISAYAIWNFKTRQLDSPRNLIEAIQIPTIKENSDEGPEGSDGKEEGPTNGSNFPNDDPLKVNADGASNGVEVDQSETLIENEMEIKNELSVLEDLSGNQDVVKPDSSQETKNNNFIKFFRRIIEWVTPKSTSLEDTVLIDGSNVKQKNSE